MKICSILIGALWFSVNCVAQTSFTDNKAYVGTEISIDDLMECQLICTYYTIKENISNEKSPAYVNAFPTDKNYLDFARTYPSYAFNVVMDSTSIGVITLVNKKEGDRSRIYYSITNPSTNRSKEIICSVWGEITELRALELIALKADTSSRIMDLPNKGQGILFNDMVYRIQNYELMKEEVSKIAVQLAKTHPSHPNQQKNILDYIERESVEGRLDYNQALLKDNQSLYVYGGLAYSKTEFAIFLWAKAVSDLGIEKPKEGRLLWQKIYGRKLDNWEYKAFKKGFKS